MIEIKLTGEDAQNYLQNENIKDEQIAQLLRDNNTLSESVTQALALYDAEVAKNKSEPSQKVKDDTKKAEELPKANFTKTLPKLGSTKETNTRWTSSEIGIIIYAASRPTGEGNRKLTTIYSKINRSRSAINSKINDLGLKTKNGFLVGTVKD